MVNYLITGATRGIGFEVTRQLAINTSNLVIAGVRDTSSAAAEKVAQLGKNVITVKIDSSSDVDPKEAVKLLQSKGIDHIDVVLANAGTATDFAPAIDVKPEDFRQTLAINTVAPLVLFQAFLPLLQKSKSTSGPKFFIVSTAIASLTIQPHLTYKATSYGASKVAANFVARRIALENPSIISLAFHPGLVKTDMGTNARAVLGSNIDDDIKSGEAITPEQSAADILKLIQDAKLESHTGKFFRAGDGTELPW